MALFELINEAYDQLYGYSPLSQRQIEYYIDIYLPILRLENVCLIVDSNDKLIGVGISIPSMSRALQKGRGRLLPTGWIHLLKAMYMHNDVVDLLLVAIKPEYQSKGVNALLFADLLPVYIKTDTAGPKATRSWPTTRTYSCNGNTSSADSIAVARHSARISLRLNRIEVNRLGCICIV